MITQQHAFESASRSYLHALIADCRINLQENQAFDYGVDGTFRPVAVYGTRRVVNGFPVGFQLKATTQWTNGDDAVLYDLEVKTYNDMVIRNGVPQGVPLALIVLCLPTDLPFVAISHERLELRKCCYWHLLKGRLSTNKRTVRIEIPKANLLDTPALERLLRDAENGTLI